MRIFNTMSYAIGIDLGGTNIKYGITDAEGNLLYEGMKPTAAGFVIESLKDIVKELFGMGFSIAGIGIGVPGIIDEGVVTGCAGNIPEIDGIRLGELIQEFSGIPVAMENDAALMGLAEFRFGAARGLSDVVFLTVGTGIGGALVVNGELYGGNRNRGGELGHIRVAYPGAPCSCGASGCMEAHASVTALVGDYLRVVQVGEQKDRPDGRSIFSAYLAGESAAVLVMHRHFEYLGAGIASLINIFSPQKVIVGGGITEAGEGYIRPIRERVFGMAMKETSAHTIIEGALLGNKAGWLGAAALIIKITL